MKNKLPILFLTLSIVLFIPVFLVIWFSDEIFEKVTPFFILIPIIITFLIWVFSGILTLTATIIWAIKKKWVCILPILIFSLISYGLFTFPYDELQREIKLSDRTLYVEAYLSNEKLPSLKGLSIGEEVVVKKYNDFTLIGFYEFLSWDNYHMTFYISQDDKTLIENFGGRGDYICTHIEKINEHWYYAEFE